MAGKVFDYLEIIILVAYYPTLAYIIYLILHFWAMGKKYIEYLMPEECSSVNLRRGRTILALVCVPMLVEQLLHMVLYSYKTFNILHDSHCSPLFQVLYKIDWYMFCIRSQINGWLILFCIELIVGGNRPPEEIFSEDNNSKESVNMEIFASESF